jgi:Asp-tRNA(Asn)/Glu-tRNA(Gln) amidotransferase A subunit family amidase
MPCGKDSTGLPIGLQLMGRYLEETTLLRGAFLIERIITDAGL